MLDLFKNTDSKVIEDQYVFDPQYGENYVSDMFLINNAQGKEVVIASDRNNLLFEVIDDEGVPTLDNTAGHGSINYGDRTVEGWDFDREPKATLPEGYKSTGRYAESVA